MNSKQLNIILGAAVIVLLGVAGYMAWGGNSSTGVLNQQQQNTGGEQAEQNQPAPQTPVAQNANTAPPTDARIALTPENVEKYFKDGCDPNLNNDKANSTVTYESKARGLSVVLPYNDKWGNAQFKLTPYDEITNEGGSYLQFAQMGLFEGGGCSRGEFIRFLPAKAAPQRIAELNAQNDGPGEELTPKPTTTSINGLMVIKYGTGGLCYYPTLEVVGKKYNYEVQHLCADDFEGLESIVKTIKLIN